MLGKLTRWFGREWLGAGVARRWHFIWLVRGLRHVAGRGNSREWGRGPGRAAGRRLLRRDGLSREGNLGQAVQDLLLSAVGLRERSDVYFAWKQRGPFRRLVWFRQEVIVIPWIYNCFLSFEMVVTQCLRLVQMTGCRIAPSVLNTSTVCPVLSCF